MCTLYASLLSRHLLSGWPLPKKEASLTPPRLAPLVFLFRSRPRKMSTSFSIWKCLCERRMLLCWAATTWLSAPTMSRVSAWWMAICVSSITPWMRARRKPLLTSSDVHLVGIRIAYSLLKPYVQLFPDQVTFSFTPICNYHSTKLNLTVLQLMLRKSWKIFATNLRFSVFILLPFMFILFFLLERETGGLNVPEHVLRN